MNISIISDVHLVPKRDEAYDYFIKFLTQQLSDHPDYIIFLGDIFDLVAGNHKQYLIDYEDIWQLISQLVHSGIKFIYFEGNHDLHLSNLLKRVAKKFEFNSCDIEVVRKYKIIYDGDFSLYLSHGDELEGSETYLKYKNFIHSKFMNFTANFLMPYFILDFFGRRASKKSRGLNYLKYSSEEEKERLKNRYREIAQKLNAQFSCSHILLGHSHYADLYHTDSWSYANCGYFSEEKQYISYLDGQLSFVEI